MAQGASFLQSLASPAPAITVPAPEVVSAVTKPANGDVVTPRLYNWAEVRSAPRLRELLIERYDASYIYGKCNVPWVVRDVLGDWTTPPADPNGPDVFAPAVGREYVAKMILDQLGRDVYSEKFINSHGFSEDHIREVQRWCITQQQTPKGQLYDELNAKRVSEITIVTRYYEELEKARKNRIEQQRREEAARRAAAARDTPPEKQQQQQQLRIEPVEAGAVRHRGAGLLPPTTPPELDDESFAAEEARKTSASNWASSVPERLAYLRAEQAAVSKMRMQARREEGNYEAHIASLPAACKALEVLGLLLIIPAVFAQDGWAIIITVPVALVIGIWGYSVSQRAMKAATLVPFSIVATLTMLGYLVYAVLRVTIWGGTDGLDGGGGDDAQTVTVVFIWVIFVMLLAIAQYSTSLAGLAQRLRGRKESRRANAIVY